MSDKRILWLGSSRTDIRAFPQDPRRAAGFQLRRVQRGLHPVDWKPMPTVGPAVREIRIHTATEHRVLYVMRFSEAVYVLHAFNKQARRTAAHDIEIARQRFRALVAWRRGQDAGRG